MFGYIPAYFLDYAVGPMEITRKVDAIGGTSVGSILGLSYAMGMNASSVFESFRKMVDDIFEQEWYTPIKFWGAKYDDDGLNKALQTMMGETRLGELEIPVVVPSVNFQNNRPKVWDNLTNESDCDEKAWEVARRSAAAPTYFVPWKNCIDGGILANCPIVETVVALHHKKGWEYSDMEVLVLGNGNRDGERNNMSKVKKWSKFEWLMPMLDYLTFGNEQANLFVAKQLGLGKLVYYDPIALKDDWAMDNPGILGDVGRSCEAFRDEAKGVILDFLATK